MTIQLEPAPTETRLLDSPKTGLMSATWINWLTLRLVSAVSSAAGMLFSTQYLNQNAAIGTTALLAAANAGVYRVSWRMRVVTPDGVASSATISVISTEGAIVITQTGAAMNGNTTGTSQSGEFLVTADGASPISFSVAYASTTPGQMVYNLQLRVEAL